VELVELVAPVALATAAVWAIAAARGLETGITIRWGLPGTGPEDQKA